MEITEINFFLTDVVRTGVYKRLFHPDSLLTGIEDAANNFARGYITMAWQVLNSVMDTIDKLAENCDGLQGEYIRIWVSLLKPSLLLLLLLLLTMDKLTDTFQFL